MTKDEHDILVVVLDEIRTFREDTTSQFDDIRTRLTNLEEAHREHIAGPGQNEQVKIDAKKVGLAGLGAALLGVVSYVMELLRH